MKRSEIVLESLRACIRVSADLIRSLKMLWMVLPVFAVIGCSESPLEPAAERSTAQVCARTALMADLERQALCDGTDPEAAEEARRGRKRQEL